MFCSLDLTAAARVDPDQRIARSAQTQIACDEKYDDHYADDVENIHCVLRLRLVRFHFQYEATALKPKTYRQANKFHFIYWRCPLLALSGHGPLHRICPLSGVNRTSRLHCEMPAYDLTVIFTRNMGCPPNCKRSFAAAVMSSHERTWWTHSPLAIFAPRTSGHLTSARAGSVFSSPGVAVSPS